MLPMPLQVVALPRDAIASRTLDRHPDDLPRWSDQSFSAVDRWGIASGALSARWLGSLLVIIKQVNRVFASGARILSSFPL